MSPTATEGLSQTSDVATQRMRNARLLRATKVYAQERRWLSWFHLFAALAIQVVLLSVAASDLWLVARIPASFLAALVTVRLFIIFHDHQHGAILRKSILADVLMTAYGLITLNPPAAWNRSHNHHHRHNAKILGANIGSYPVMTVNAYAGASPRRRALYAVTRHPLTIAGGYLTVFLWGMCIRPLLMDPRANLGAVASLVVHASCIVGLAYVGWDVVVLAFLAPAIIAAAIGAYLFYAQHNYPTVVLHDRAAWDHVGAALESSSFVKMGPIMHWFTGNIGYHHVHHLNARIPFYRLPEAMAAMAELQSPGVTSLGVGDVARCLSLKLWDPSTGRLVTFPRAA